jgi:hypothetical protein
MKNFFFSVKLRGKKFFSDTLVPLYPFRNLPYGGFYSILRCVASQELKGEAF